MQPMRKIPNELVLISLVNRATERERAEKRYNSHFQLHTILLHKKGENLCCMFIMNTTRISSGYAGEDSV